MTAAKIEEARESTTLMYVVARSKEVSQAREISATTVRTALVDEIGN